MSPKSMRLAMEVNDSDEPKMDGIIDGDQRRQ